LWLAYGLAILFSGLATAVGLLHMVMNKACYSDNFSTIFQAARRAHFESVGSSDFDGRDPLPKFLGNARIRFRRVENGRGAETADDVNKAVDDNASPRSSLLQGDEDLDMHPMRFESRATI
jgi:hypothetical protein